MSPVSATVSKVRRVHHVTGALATMLWALGCVRIYQDGGSFNGVYRAWNPLTWVLVLVMLPFCAVLGERLFEVVPFRLTAYWKQREADGKLCWVTPFTRLAELPARTKFPGLRKAQADLAG